MFVSRHSNLKVYVHHYIFVFIKQSSIVLVSGLKICQWHFQHICCKNKGLLLFLLFFIFACMTLVVKHQLKVALSKKILRQYCEEEMWVLGFPNHECQKSCCLGPTIFEIPYMTFCLSFLTMSSNVLPLNLKQTFPPIIWIFTEGEGDGMESGQSFKKFYFTAKNNWLLLFE